MKKGYVIFLIGTLMLVFSACSGDGNGEPAATGGTGGTPYYTGQGGVPSVGGQTAPPAGGQTAPPVGGQTAPLAGSGGVEAGSGVEAAGSGGVEAAGSGGVEAAGSGGVEAAGSGGVDAPPGDFEECIAGVPTGCEALSFTTAAQMNSRCMDSIFHTIPLTQPDPLTGEMTHGPVIIEAGPYGAEQMWNQGVADIPDTDTAEFMNTINIGEVICNPIGIDSFAEPFEVTDDLKNVRDIDQAGYTVFKPACMKEGETYPLITWANGTCGYTHGYSMLLGAIAAYGYVIIASNSTMTAATAGLNGVTVQINAINYGEAINELPNHPLYQKIDLNNIGAMGHSQGAAATASNAGDSRIKALILWNSGTSNVKPFLDVSGERDLGDPGLAGMPNGTNSASQPGAWLYHLSVLHTGGSSTGHLVNMMQPDRCIRFAVRWWDYWLKGDQTARDEWAGDCAFCEDVNDGLDDGVDHCACGVNQHF